MTVAAPTVGTLLDSALTADSVRVEMGVRMLKKAQDLESQQGSALVQLIESAAAAPVQGQAGTGLDVLA